MSFKDYLLKLGLKRNDHVLVHSSFRKIRSAFPNITIEDVINDLKVITSEEGSVIMPAFTYCFKKSTNDHEVFDQKNSPSKVGALSEVFRKMDDTTRTSSPTHSFTLWGSSAKEISSNNSPKSPLGKDSPIDWMMHKSAPKILMLGVDFSSLTFGHYLEVMAPVPWADYSPWDYMNVLKKGVSTKGEKDLVELPGCAKSFVNFEQYLLDSNFLKPVSQNELSSYLIDMKFLYEIGIKYFRNNYDKLLCPKGTCRPCDARRSQFLE